MNSVIRVLRELAITSFSDLKKMQKIAKEIYVFIIFLQICIVMIPTEQK